MPPPSKQAKAAAAPAQPNGPVASAPAPAAEQSPDALVRVYNKSRKPYTHEIYLGDAAGRSPAKHVAAPSAFTTIPRWLAEKWTKEYPEDLLPGDSALAAVDPDQANLQAEKEKSRALEQELAALKADMDELKAQLAQKQGE